MNQFYLFARFLIATLLCSLPAAVSFGEDAAIQLRKGDHISIIGNTLADRMQHHGWLETYLQAMHPEHELSVRNLGFAGDELKTRPRSQNFGSPDEWLSKTETNVVLCFFGYNEALRGDAGLGKFRDELGQTIDGMRAQKYDGQATPTLVFFSPIAHENLDNPNLPNGEENNKQLAKYTGVMQEVCQQKGVLFVDLFHPTQELYESSSQPLTMNGIHLLESGNRELTNLITQALFGQELSKDISEEELQKLRAAILEKNLHWYSRYRVVDGYNVYGGRSSLNWHGQSNYDVMQREMAIFDVMTKNRDQRIWAVAAGGDLEVTDDNIPPLLDVKTNRPGPLEDQKFAYLGGEEAIGKMKLAEGMQANLFASEEMFPELVNPVQMAVDTDGRLFASVWPSYPHWNPTHPRTDQIVCLPDENGDGVADKCVVFADELNSITGFEFWGGGMLVSAPPEIWFLKDTDGDDKADYKLRVLQGLSSADTHHTANAMVIGSDGALYWSRGVFHVTNMETPTKTFRSSKSGVYRFDPRTFEISFHFPIGPNPHGDVFDQWGYQFVNDGTGGTGSYVNIGKGVGNKQWFKKRVRPVSATGILSSSHFPEANNGNFLICNTIGFLGVLQHEVKYNGADITAEEIEPILVSSDPNFRPTDVEVGGDGALYVSDWSNALIGHMQHNIRDPNRDHAHGRIYRVTHKNRPMLKPVKLKGQPIETVLAAFFSKENGTRYRARLELSGRDTKEVTQAVSTWAKKLDPSSPDQAQALLEGLWVFQEHRVPNLPLLEKIYRGAEDARIRAAAIRTLGQWGPRVENWEELLNDAARDESALVRAEAVKAAVSFQGLAAAEIIFEVAGRPIEPGLDTVLNYARQQIQVDKLAQDAVKRGVPLSDAAQSYLLRNASIDDLLKLERNPAVYRAIVERERVSPEHLHEALDGLAKAQDKAKIEIMLQLIEKFDAGQQAGSLKELSAMLPTLPQQALAKVKKRTMALAADGKTPETRQAAYAAWIIADGKAKAAFGQAQRDKSDLRDALAAVAKIPNDEIRASLYDTVRPLISTLPSNLANEESSGQLDEPGIQVDYFEPNPSNVAIETLAKLTPAASGVAAKIAIDVPQLKRRDAFALRFTGNLRIDKTGDYRFFLASDDGSRLYIGNELLINNDGNHGMLEKSAKIRLEAGVHPLVVTYYDNGGADGLKLTWQGPNFGRQAISDKQLSIGGGETLHDVAIGTLTNIPGRDAEKFDALAALINSGQHRTSAVRAMLTVPSDAWNDRQIGATAQSLAEYVSEIPAKYRTGKAALEAMQLTDALAAKLPEAEARELQSKLADLKVQVIRIGTVPYRMIYDKERLAIQAGKPVEFVFSNTDNMPHNFAIVSPGSLEEIGLQAEATARDADAMARHYIPKSDQVLLGSRLLQPGDTQALSFVAPTKPGIYPYVCTYPGHWRRMYGALYVVADLKQYLQDPAIYLANNPLPLRDELLKYNDRNTEWSFAALNNAVKTIAGHDHSNHHADKQTPFARNYDVGKNVFKVANCVACHRMNGEGYEFGPDLTKLADDKHNTTHILRSIVEPSKEIDKKYENYSFELDSGKIITGLIVAEDDDHVEVIVDPIAKPEPTRIAKSSIEERTKLPTSTMPSGLVNKLSREEILDLIAYIYARGDAKSKLFEVHKH